MMGLRRVQCVARSARAVARRFGAARPGLVPQDYRRLERLFRDFDVTAV